MRTRNRRILLTGVTGQVGSQLLPLLETSAEVIAPTRAHLDLRDASAIRHFVQTVQPHWIVNAAAYTAVDDAELEPDTAFAINAGALGVLGEEAFRLGTPMLHFSTDYVFSGSGSTPWLETDTPAPLGIYGASKLDGEQALAASGAAHLIFRTSWVYGATGKNFLRTILRLAQEQKEIRIVADQHGAPTWSHDLARLIIHTIERTEQQAQGTNSLADAIKPVAGTYHACNAGFTTWFGFAEEALRLARSAEPHQAFATLLPVTTTEYPTRAVRPLNSRLNGDKLKRQLGFTMPAWQDSLAAVMAEIQAHASR